MSPTCAARLPSSTGTRTHCMRCVAPPMRIRVRSSARRRRQLIKTSTVAAPRALLRLTRVLTGPVCGCTFAGKCHSFCPLTCLTVVLNNSSQRGRPAPIVTAPALPQRGHLTRRVCDHARPQQPRGCRSGPAVGLGVVSAGCRGRRVGVRVRCRRASGV